jgi:uncharacterized LabA/DUF88 family protein
MANERVMVFIDGANLYMGVKHGLKQDKLVKVDALAQKLVGARELVRIYYYNTPTPSKDPKEQQINQKFLTRLGWIDNLQIRLGRIMPRTYTVECPKCKEKVEYKTHIQKGVDTHIAVDMVTLAVSGAYDAAILVSGDSDLAEAVNFIREHTHKKVENACIPDKSWNKTLREASDKRIPLTLDYLNDCWLP